MFESNLNLVLLLTCVTCVVRVHHVESYVVMVFSSDNFQSTIRFSASYFNSLFDCMLEKYVRCQADYQYNHNFKRHEVTSVKRSSNTDVAAYICEVHNSTVWSGYILCSTRVNQCQLSNTCRSFTEGIFILNSNVYLSGSNIESCVTSCVSLTFYHITAPSTKPTIIATTRPRIRVRPITNTSLKPVGTTSLNTVRMTSFNTATMTHLTNTTMSDTPSNNLSSSTLIGVVVPGAVFLVLCFSFVFLCWRKRKSRIDQSNYSLSSNSIRLTEKSVYVNNNIVTTGKHNQMGSSLDQSRIETTEQLYINTRETAGDCSKYGVEDGYTDVEQRQDCFYTTIENGTDNTDRSRSHGLKRDTLDYNNIVMENVVNQDTTTLTNTKVNSCGGVSSNVDYNNIVENPGSEYQRLRQERREFLNPYDCFVETENNKELSPCSIAESVSGETTLQVIGVGAWVDNSGDIKSNSKHYRSQSNTQDGDSFYHEPTCDGDRNILGYTLMNKWDEQ
ncbi:uncharacterized protein LOC131944890 [Physella acuta]|uniref:uncharacterized protein LOC131944890 n=1 Tax=Physella acuta TaxID=109671 RepID=UPI0027DCCD32|nr:uncharacterized protein LOC131944890 [Physella acuta]